MLSLTILLAILGPVQGGAIKHAKLPSRIIIAACFGYLSASVCSWGWFYGLWVWIALNPGVGQPEGYIIQAYQRGLKEIRPLYDKSGKHGELEWWQPEVLRHKPWASLVLRDAMFLNPAFMIASPIAMYIGLRLPEIWYMDKNRWHESLHYSIAFLLFYALISFL